MASERNLACRMTWMDFVYDGKYGDEVGMAELAERVLVSNRRDFRRRIGVDEWHEHMMMAMRHIRKEGRDQSAIALMYFLTEPDNQPQTNGCATVRLTVVEELVRRLPGLTGEVLMREVKPWQMELLGWVAYRLDELSAGETVNVGVMDRILTRFRREVDKTEAAVTPEVVGTRVELPVAA